MLGFVLCFNFNFSFSFSSKQSDLFGIN